jgi:hypothetical protein
MLHIDIFIPFYTYFTDEHRYKWTRIIFKHMATVAGKLSSRAQFTFTLLGSEGNRSRNLAKEYMDEKNYYEFDQAAAEFHGKDFWYMFDKKIKTGMQVAKSKNPDIILWMGSNDYVPLKFFQDVIDFYSNNGFHDPQMYGIDNFQNGGNAVFFCKYHGESNSIDFHNEAFWWNGKSPYPRDKYLYSAGIIGLNKAAYTRYPDLITNWSFDEGEDEWMMRNKGNIKKFTSNKLFYYNIKMASGKELNTFQSLKGYLGAGIIKFTDLDPAFQTYIIHDTNYLIDLMKSCA